MWVATTDWKVVAKIKLYETLLDTIEFYYQDAKSITKETEDSVRGYHEISGSTSSYHLSSDFYEKYLNKADDWVEENRSYLRNLYTMISELYEVTKKIRNEIEKLEEKKIIREWVDDNE